MDTTSIGAMHRMGVVVHNKDAADQLVEKIITIYLSAFLQVEKAIQEQYQNIFSTIP